MASTNYNDFIRITEEQVTCISPTPERETYHQISFGRKNLSSKINNHIKAAKSGVRKKLISATFGAIQVHALEAMLNETSNAQ